MDRRSFLGDLFQALASIQFLPWLPKANEPPYEVPGITRKVIYDRDEQVLRYYENGVLIKTIGVYLMDDCDYIAAESEEQVRQWYIKLTGIDCLDEEHNRYGEGICRCNLHEVVADGDPHDADVPRITFHDMIIRDIDQQFPLYLACDGHYC